MPPEIHQVPKRPDATIVRAEQISKQMQVTKINAVHMQHAWRICGLPLVNLIEKMVFTKRCPKQKGAHLSVNPFQTAQQRADLFGRRDQTRTDDPHHVKVSGPHSQTIDFNRLSYGRCRH